MVTDQVLGGLGPSLRWDDGIFWFRGEVRSGMWGWLLDMGWGCQASGIAAPLAKLRPTPVLAALLPHADHLRMIFYQPGFQLSQQAVRFGNALFDDRVLDGVAGVIVQISLFAQRVYDVHALNR